MRAYLLACLATIVLGAGGYFLLGAVQQPSGVAYTTDGARIATSWSWHEPATTQAKICDPLKSWQWIFVDFGNPHGEPALCSISQ